MLKASSTSHTRLLTSGREGTLLAAVAPGGGNNGGLSIQFACDFTGAVGYFCRGGIGKVRFGRTVVERSGKGYVLWEPDVAAMESEHPAEAMKLHRMMAGTLTNPVISRTKLITEYTVR